MKKRLLSLLLAVVLVLGAAIAPAADADAAKKVTYTKITLKSVTTPVTFNVIESKRAVAAKNLNTTLANALKKNATFTIKVGEGDDAVTYTAKKTSSKTIKVGDQTLKAFIAANEGSKTSIVVNVNLKKALALVKLSKKAGAFGFRTEIGSANFKDLKISKKNKITFTGNGTKFTAYVKGGVLYLKGNQKKSKFVKNLVKAGVTKKVTTKKIKTATLAK